MRTLYKDEFSRILRERYGCLKDIKTTTGRRRYSEDEDILTLFNPFVSDEAKLLCSKALRSLAFKTQVFTLPKNKNVRNRKVHTDEVVAISVVLGEMLGLNCDLIRAAALGHDIGHVPLGHQGERWFQERMGKPDFCHEKMGPIIAQKIERKGKGLNLCHETLEAMMRHSGNLAVEGMSQEAWLIRYCDKFAYIFADINDITRFGIHIPRKIMEIADLFGKTQRERTTMAMMNLFYESSELGKVSFKESDLAENFDKLRTSMYSVYKRITQQKISNILDRCYECIELLEVGDPFLILAMMNDEDIYKISNHQGMMDYGLLNDTTVREALPYFDEIGIVDMCDSDLDW